MKSQTLILHPDFRVHNSIKNFPGTTLLFNPKDFYQVTEELVAPFNDYIDEHSAQYSSEIDWWVSSVGCRNTFQTQALLSVSYLFYLKRLLEKKVGINKIIVYSPALKEAIRKNFRDATQNIEITSVGQRSAAVELLYHVVRLEKFFIEGLKRKFFCLISGPKKEFHGPINLIDIFVFKDSFNIGEFQDKYYGEFIDKTHAQSKWVYLPTLTYQADTFANFRAMKKNRTPFLIKDDYLNFTDYIFAAGHVFRLTKLLKPFKPFFGINIDPILQQDIYNNLTKTSLAALLDYRLCLRMHEAKISIKVLWDWFENQNIDKAIAMGLRAYYNDSVKIIGYAGYLPSKYAMNVFPTKEEQKAKILPDTIAVMSMYQKESITMYNKNLQVVLAPSFRYTHLFKNSGQPRMTRNKSTLIALPMLPDKSLEILNMLPALGHTLLKNAAFLIKPHPVTKEEMTRNFLDLKLPPNFNITQQNSHELLKEISVIVANSSSIFFEALSYGIPGIIVASQTQIDNNLIPTTIDSKIWSHCFNPEEFLAALIKYLYETENQENDLLRIGEKARGYFFTDYTTESENTLSEILR